MIKGVMIFEQGGLQQIGEVNSFAGIINTIKEILPKLEAEEAKRVLDTVSDEELEKILEVRKNKIESKK